MDALTGLLIVTFAAVESGLFGWAVGTYWQLDAIRWYLTRLVPVAGAIHLLALALLLVLGGRPGHDTYLLGMLLGLVVGLPAATFGTWALQRHFDRRFVAKPADLRALEDPQPERVHAALDPERSWVRRRIDAEEGDVVPRRLPPVEGTTDDPGPRPPDAQAPPSR